MPSNPASIVTPTKPMPLNEFGHSPQPESLVIILSREDACKLLPAVE